MEEKKSTRRSTGSSLEGQLSSSDSSISPAKTSVRTLFKKQASEQAHLAPVRSQSMLIGVRSVSESGTMLSRRFPADRGHTTSPIKSPFFTRRAKPKIFENDESLFSVCVNQSVKEEGFLEVSAGEWITIVYSDDVDAGEWLARKAKVVGKIKIDWVDVDLVNSPNIYLEAVDVLRRELPDIIETMMNSVDPEFQQIENQIVPLLIARHCLFEELKTFCEKESKSPISYREDASLARRVINVLLQSNPTKIAFKDAFLTFLWKSIWGDKGTSVVRIRGKSMYDYPRVLSESMAYLTQQLNDHYIPPEVILILRVIREISRPADSQNEVEQQEYIEQLTKVFFFRFLLPTVSKNNPDDTSDEIIASPEFIALSKLFVMLGTRKLPAEDENFFPIRKDLEGLLKPMANFLEKMADSEAQKIPSQSLIEGAARFYWFVSKKFGCLTELEKTLGKEADFPKIEMRIKKISVFIEESLANSHDLNCGRKG